MTGFDDHQHQPTLKQLSSKIGLAIDAPRRRLHAPVRHRRSFRKWLNDYAAREGIVERAVRRVGHWVLLEHPRLGVTLALMIGGLGAGYTWATVFGDGIHGGKTGAALDQAPSYPNADAAAVAGIALLGAASLFLPIAVTQARNAQSSGRLFAASLAAIMTTGLVLFLLSRLFV